MRIFLKILLVGSVLSFSSCSNKIIQPVSNPNPWADDYRSISGMENYMQWGPYNVHDPSVRLVGDTYYAYSTDAIFAESRKEIKEKNLPFGYIQVRKSKDLVNWEFVGWAFEEIPEEAKNWVLENSGGRGATNIWAPYMLEHNGKYRLYYSVSAFARQTSYIGLAESDSPEGPWELKGCVVKTKTGDQMNAIDPSIVTNPETGEQWMHYGSYFGGLFCVQLNPETGLTMVENDQGHLTAKRFNLKKNNNEAPEIIYNPELKKYFLFVSYDPLMTTYNIRVGRSDNPEGPFVDYFGKDFRLDEDNLPILTYPYQFKGHKGWAGTGHNSTFRNEKGDYFIASQARLSPDNHLMVMHVRQIFWTKDGWPVVSPQRYAGTEQQNIKKKDVAGNWEIITIHGDAPLRDLEAGQILWGENLLKSEEVNRSQLITLEKSGKISGELNGEWKYEKGELKLNLEHNNAEVQLFMGQDWENEMKTILFTGLNDRGYSVWGKKVKSE
ncbi:MAG: family 43 glycosylhydrolase [Porphyromonadaceae bacterium]|nr:family 43 glycosylhydrolase [Porphyromonadaceae bacterium]